MNTWHSSFPPPYWLVSGQAMPLWVAKISCIALECCRVSNCGVTVGSMVPYRKPESHPLLVGYGQRSQHMVCRNPAENTPLVISWPICHLATITYTHETRSDELCTFFMSKLWLSPGDHHGLHAVEHSKPLLPNREVHGHHWGVGNGRSKSNLLTSSRAHQCWVHGCGKHLVIHNYTNCLHMLVQCKCLYNMCFRYLSLFIFINNITLLYTDTHYRTVYLTTVRKCQKPEPSVWSPTPCLHTRTGREAIVA